MQIRLETERDIAPIRALTQAAFAGAEHSDGNEAEIVAGLRQGGALRLSLVAEEDGVVLGHTAFSPVRIAGEDLGWVGLGPVSVHPDRQGQGIGQALIREGLARLRQSGSQGCVVLGDPGYYSRFGFVADPDLSFAGVPPEYFMRLGLGGAIPRGAVTYAAPFYGETPTG